MKRRLKQLTLTSHWSAYIRYTSAGKTYNQHSVPNNTCKGNRHDTRYTIQTKFLIVLVLSRYSAFLFSLPFLRTHNISAYCEYTVHVQNSAHIQTGIHVRLANCGSSAFVTRHSSGVSSILASYELRVITHQPNIYNELRQCYRWRVSYNWLINDCNRICVVWADYIYIYIYYIFMKQHEDCGAIHLRQFLTRTLVDIGECEEERKHDNKSCVDWLISVCLVFPILICYMYLR